MFELPNWHDRAAYPAPDASNTVFAWEFLRRNPEYQAAWSGYLQTLRTGAGDDVELLDYINSLATPRGHVCRALWSELTPAQADELDRRLTALPCSFVREQSESETQFVIRPLDSALAARWGLEALVNPGSAYDFYSVRFTDAKRATVMCSGGLKELEDAEGGPLGLINSRFLVLKIDLEWPLEVIEELTMRMIKERRQSLAARGVIKPIDSRSRRPELLAGYLRLLDAVSAGASLQRAAEVLFPDEANDPPDYPRDKRVSAAFSVAERMRQGGYAVLPLLKDKPKKKVKKN